MNEFIRNENQYCDIMRAENIQELLESEKQYFIELFKLDAEIKKLVAKKITINKLVKSLEIDIKITEAHRVSDPAFNELKNETARNAFRRLASAADRKKLSEQQAEFEACTMQLKNLENERESQLACISGVRARINLTASIFNYMSGK